MDQSFSPTNKAILVASLMLGACANLLFFGKAPGVSFFVFVLLFLAALILVGRRTGSRFSRQNLWLLLPALFFAAMVAVRDNRMLSTLNVLAATALLSLFILYSVSGRVGESGLLTTLTAPIYSFGKILGSTSPFVSQSAGSFRIIWRNQRSVLPIVRGGLAAVPVLMVFAVLLVLADVVYADLLFKLFRIERIFTIANYGTQGVFILVISLLTAGGISVAMDKRDKGAELDHRLNGIRRHRFMGYTESMTVLTLVNLLFLSFVVVQVRYLFGGESNISSLGYTYAEYARHGFFELLAVSILSLLLILGLETFTWRETKQQFKLFNALSSLMIMLVLVIMISAFTRMHLYEIAYGYTELRLFVYVFIIWLGIFLLWFLYGLWRRPERFGLGLLLVGIGFLATLNMLNPDAFIVRQNVKRYMAGGKLDSDYLDSLSLDAVPELVRAINADSNPDSKIVSIPCPQLYSDGTIGYCETVLAIHLQAALYDRFLDMRADTDSDHWQSFKSSRWRAYQELSGLFE
ncbi:MAG: DUF4153 domain-containing protein [Candidatus Promineifilaceae bacterium]